MLVFNAVRCSFSSQFASHYLKSYIRTFTKHYELKEGIDH